MQISGESGILPEIRPGQKAEQECKAGEGTLLLKKCPVSFGKRKRIEKRSQINQGRLVT